MVTNGQAGQQQAKLVATGLADVCGPVLASTRLGVAKPDPRAYAAACARMSVAPARALMVGDNYELDVVAARAAGLRAVHLDRDGSGLDRDGSGSNWDGSGPNWDGSGPEREGGRISGLAALATVL